MTCGYRCIDGSVFCSGFFKKLAQCSRYRQSIDTEKCREREGMGGNDIHFLWSNNTLCILALSYGWTWKSAFFIQGQKTDFSLQTGTVIHHVAQPYFATASDLDIINQTLKLICQQLGFDYNCMSNYCRYLGWNGNDYL